MMLIDELLIDKTMMADWPSGICQPEQGWDNSKPLLVILASCHGRTLLTYFNMKPEFRSQFNIVRLETGPIYMREYAGEPVMTRPSMVRLLSEADVLVTYNMGDNHGSFSLSRIKPLLKSGCKIVTFAAPNFSAFWPVSGNYCGVLAVMNALDRGKSEAEIHKDFDDGSFDPIFHLRWRIEMGRIEYRDKTHDVKLGDFILRNHKTHKLFMSAGHPSFTTIAWLGSGVILALGFPAEDESAVLAYDHAIDCMGKWPETDYEFNHYGFTYPKRYAKVETGGMEIYHELIRSAVKFSNEGGYCSIHMD